MIFSWKTVLRRISTLGVENLPLRIQGKLLLPVLLLVGVLSSFQPLAAQVFNISTGDDLNSAVTAINAGGAPATIQFNASPIDLGTLASPLGTLQYATLLNGSVSLTNSTRGLNTDFTSMALVEIGAGYNFSLAGQGFFGQDAGGNGYAGNAADFTSGSLNVDAGSAFNLLGGRGDDSDSGTTGLGGNGGGANLSVSGAVSVDSSSVSIAAGDGGNSYGNKGGYGGDASASLGSLSLASNSGTGSFYLHGGNGGVNNDSSGMGPAGDSGNASLTVAGAVSIDSSNLEAVGSGSSSGFGAAGTTEGAGGNAWVSVGGGLSLNSDSYYSNAATIGQYSDLYVSGGDGADDYNLANGGNGGNGTLLVSGGTLVDSGEIDVAGGTGGLSYAANGGNGGNASFSLGQGLTLTSSNGAGSIYVDGGDAGYNDDYALGVGGRGGAATLTVAGAVSMDSSYLEVGGGDGNYGYGAMGTTEGAGGNAWASIGGALDLTSENYYNGSNNGEKAQLYVSGGDSAYDYYLGNSGNAGNASLGVSGAVSADSSEIDVAGGSGDYADGGTGGNGGDASLAVGSDLTLTSTYDTGDLYVDGGAGGYNDDSVPGVGGKGGDASLSVAGAVSVDSAYLEVGGGNGDYGYGAPGQTEGAGGDASATFGGALNLTSENYYNGLGNGQFSQISILGGAGAYDYNIANGGDGGNASLRVSGAVSVDSSELQVAGGSAGYAYYGGDGGNGGDASLFLGSSLSLTSAYTTGELYVDGGAGNNVYSDDGYTSGLAGKGGDAALSVAGAVSVDSAYLEVVGGDDSGDDGYGNAGTTEGAGGNASVTLGSLSLASENYYNGSGNGQESELYISGGGGSYDNGYSASQGGEGGVVALQVSGAVSVDSSELYLYGGDGGYSDGADGGKGGDARMLVDGNLSLTSAYAGGDLEIDGGYGGYNYDYGAGVAGKGGDASLSVAGAVSVDSAYLEVVGGDDSSEYGYGGAGTTEGAGGDASVTLGSLSLASENYYNGSGNGQESELYISGGGGAYDDGYSASQGGEGGTASLQVSGAVSVDSSELYLYGGDGGYSYNGPGGNGGDARMLVGGDLDLTSAYTYGDLEIVGGDAGYNDGYSDSLLSGRNGNAVLSVAGAVSMDSAYMEVGGGSGNIGYGALGETEPAGGDASVTLGSLSLASENYYNGNYNGEESEIYIYGGSGSYDSEYSYPDGSANGGNGGNATLSVAGAVSVDSALITIGGGAGGSSENADGGKGGNALLSIGGSLALTSNYEYADLEVAGGDGSYNDDVYGPGVGGGGGNAVLSVAGAVSVDSGYVSVGGGAGDYGNGSAGTTEGAGGDALVTLGSLALTSENYYNGNNNGQYSVFGIQGGTGAYDYDGYGADGNGGLATLSVAGPVSVDSGELGIYGGAAGEYCYYADAGNGGNALLSVGGNLALTSAYAESYLYLEGGAAGYNDDYDGVGGKGGDAALSVAGAVSMDSSYVSVGGGDGNSGYGLSGQTEGAGGNATATMAGLVVTNSRAYSDASFNLEGGYGGSDYDYANGGKGGDATLDVSGAVSVDAGALNVTAGDGGSASTYNAGKGGNASATASSASLDNAAAITVEGGNGASGGVNGNGGNAVLSVNSLDLADSASSLYLSGGASGGSGAVSGMANANIGDLTGAGYIYLNGGTGSALNISNGGDFTGIIDGNAALDKTGSGALTLAGADTYTGGTNVNGGTLAVAAGNALGTGDVNVNGGTLAANNGPLTVAVGGNYAQGASGTLQLGLAGVTVGQWDTLNVAGTASLDGTLNLTSYNGFTPSKGQTFDVVDSTGALSGRFGAVSDTFFMPVSATYGANNVTVQMLSFSDFGATPNQKAVASVLDSFAGTTAHGALSDLVTSVPNADLPSLYDEVAPEGLTPVYQIGFSTAQNEASLIGQRLDALFGLSLSGNGAEARGNGESPMFAGTLSPAEEAGIAADVSRKDRYGVFAMGSGDFGTVTGDSNAAGYKYTTTGITAGMDTVLAPRLVGGLLLGYASSNTTQSNSDNVKVTGAQAGFYAGLKSGGLHLEALVDGGLNNYKTQRGIGSSVATGLTQGLQYGGQLGLGYDVDLGGAKLGPFASGQYTYVQLDAYQEQGSPAALSIPSQGQGSLLTDLGAKASTDWKLGGGASLAPNLSLAWEHLAQGNANSMSAALQGSSFTVAGTALGTDGVAVGAGLAARFAGAWSAFVQYQGKLGITRYDSQDLSGGVNLGF